MIRMVLYLLAVAALATGLSWLADRPGSMIVSWEGYEIETSVFRAVVIFALILGVAVFIWSLLRQLLSSPANLGRYFVRRRQERGLDALSSGMIAIGAGDGASALRHAVQARKALPNEPLTQLLRAQAAQLAGDRTTSRRIFEAMLGQPDTEQLGLRGLFLEAEREGETEAARQFAERALKLNARLGWPVEALFEMQCKDGDWDAGLQTLAAGRRSGQMDKAIADRRRAILLTAKAQEIEDGNGAKAQEYAVEAHNLAPNLIPAAAIAGRQLASRGSTPKAAKIIERTWKLAQHPELALVYAYARPGDSPRDRMDRIRRLARLAPNSPEGPIALATAAIEGRDWTEARAALAPLIEGGLTQRVCTLMARIEGGEHNDAGRVREWLARAASAPADPVWTADGVVSDRWAPVSPVTGALDAFAWKVPAERNVENEASLALKKIEELVMLGTPPDNQRQVAPGLPGAELSPSESASPTSEHHGDAPVPTDSRDLADVRSVAAALRPASDPALRTRSAEANRPITVEVRPVAPDPAQPRTATPAVSPLANRPATATPQAGANGAGRTSAPAAASEPKTFETANRDITDVELPSDHGKSADDRPSTADQTPVERLETVKALAKTMPENEKT